MKRIIHLLILAAIFCTGTVSCKKETLVDDFVIFGQLNIENKTTYNSLLVQLEGIDTQLSPKDIKLKPGPNQLKVWGNTGVPTDKPVQIFDTLLNVTAKNAYNFLLFQVDPGKKPVVMLNNQLDEPAPEEGFLKIKMANLAPNCFPGKIDVLMKMIDYNYGDLVDMDVMKDVKPTYGSFGKYKTFSPINSDGIIYFYILDPVTQQPLHTDFIYGADIMDYKANKFYNIITLFITEKEDSNGNITGIDGKQYNVTVETLFIN